ncbi:unnamed protein product, partial [Meganyctiphanes norvegica]
MYINDYSRFYAELRSFKNIILLKIPSDFVKNHKNDKIMESKLNKGIKNLNNRSSNPFHRLLSRNNLLLSLKITIANPQSPVLHTGSNLGGFIIHFSIIPYSKLEEKSIGNGGVSYINSIKCIANTTFLKDLIMISSFACKRNFVHICNLHGGGGAAWCLFISMFRDVTDRWQQAQGGGKKRRLITRKIRGNHHTYHFVHPLEAVDQLLSRNKFSEKMHLVPHIRNHIFLRHKLRYEAENLREHCHLVGRFTGDSYDIELREGGKISGKGKTHSSTVDLKDSAKANNSNDPLSKNQGNKMSASERSKGQKKPQEGEKAKNGIWGGSTQSHMLNVIEHVSNARSTVIGYRGYYISCILIVRLILNIDSSTAAVSAIWCDEWLNGFDNTSITIANETIISHNIADNPDSSFYQTVYGCLILVILGTSLTRGFAFMKVSLHASSRMHDNVFVKVFRSPMSFFDTTPSGRIINIFSRDMDEIDVMLPNTLETFLQNLWLIGCSLMFVCLVFPHFLPILLLLAVLFIFIRSVFRIGIRDFKRMENLSRSPLYSHVSTTVNGLATINAYGKQEMFTKKFMVLFDENSANFYMFNCALRWLAVRLDLLALLVTASTAMLSLLLRGSVDAAFAGLALAYSAQLSGIFQFTVRLSTETEARFTSVQRINNYIKGLVSEAPPIIESTRPEISWPKYGRISFRNVEMRYRPETPLVLKGITLHIDEEEKIGVVGRTGSGKSSLGVAIFRMVELAGGKINIDHIDISTLGLEDLRSHISIIPQDPTLFIGTIRYNLDPFDRHPDAAIWNALEQTYMKDTISAMPKSLLSPVIENGENFSVGERQLLCMARALLRNSKILFLDEATAAIDTQTDAKIQKTLSEAFKNCTMITVAHRLNTVMSCSRVLVMDDGKVAEFDSPAALTANPNSAFAKMLASFDTKPQT